MLQTIKPRNARSKRALEARAPKLIENQKTALLLRGTTASDLIQNVLTDLHSLKKPHTIKFNKKNEVRPFEDPEPLEFFSKKNDASLLVLGSHSKKRPQNLVFTRTFQYQVLDQFEFGVDPETYKAIGDPAFKGVAKCAVGLKPMLLFSGNVWETDEKLKMVKSLFMDFFRGETVKAVDVEGLQLVISFLAAEKEGGEGTPTVHMRCNMIKTKKSGHKLPRVEVEEMGPRLDLTLRRVQEPREEMLKEALKVPKSQEAKTKKNISTDIIGDKIGRIHTGKQDLSKMQSRKMKGLKKRDIADVDDDATLVDADEGVITSKKSRRS